MNLTNLFYIFDHSLTKYSKMKRDEQIFDLIEAEKQRQLAQEKEEDYEVFMAIAEKLGKDRRGNPIHLRDDDGAEILYNVELYGEAPFYDQPETLVLGDPVASFNFEGLS